jgi:hypothetical protein
MLDEKYAVNSLQKRENSMRHSSIEYKDDHLYPMH